MVSTKEELQDLSENEGVVIGSILVTAEKGPEGESALAGLFKGARAENVEWSIFIWETGFNPFKTTYHIVVKPASEEIFIKKLPVGSYRVDRMEQIFAGTKPPRALELHMSVHFSVKPRQTSYIGKLAVDFPHRMRLGSQAKVRVLDASGETVEKLRVGHPSIAGNAVKDLATLEQQWGSPANPAAVGP